MVRSDRWFQHRPLQASAEPDKPFRNPGERSGMRSNKPQSFACQSAIGQSAGVQQHTHLRKNYTTNAANVTSLHERNTQNPRPALAATGHPDAPSNLDRREKATREPRGVITPQDGFFCNQGGRGRSFPVAGPRGVANSWLSDRQHVGNVHLLDSDSRKRKTEKLIVVRGVLRLVGGEVASALARAGRKAIAPVCYAYSAQTTRYAPRTLAIDTATTHFTSARLYSIRSGLVDT